MGVGISRAIVKGYRGKGMGWPAGVYSAGQCTSWEKLMIKGYSVTPTALASVTTSLGQPL